MKRCLNFCAIVGCALSIAATGKAEGVRVAALQPARSEASPSDAPGGDQWNFYVRASSQFIALASKKDGQDLQQEIEQRQNKPIQDCILGTSISGTTNLVDMNRGLGALTPSDNGAIFLMRHDGTVTSQTVGQHPPVTIYSHGTTHYTAYSQLIFDENGFRPYGCTSASACTSTCIDGLCICGGRLVQKIATKRVYRSKGEAEQEAGAHAAARVSQEIDNSTPGQLDNPEDAYSPNRYLHAKIIDPLKKWNAYPALKIQSTGDALYIYGREYAAGPSGVDRGQTAAPALPTVWFTPSVLSVRVHETFVNNMAEKTLGGQTRSDDDLSKAYKDLFGDQLKKVPADQAGGDNAPPEADSLRSITFTKQQPVIVKFNNDEFSITIRAERYGRPAVVANDKEPGKRTEMPGMAVTADYKIHRDASGRPDHADRPALTIKMTDEGRKLLEDKKLSLPPKPPGVSYEALAQRRAKHYFDERFPERLDFKGLEFKSGALAKHVTDVYGNLPSTQFISGQGWLTVGWSLPAAKKSGT